MSALREWAASLGEAAHKAVAVSSLGKWKTTTQVQLLLATCAVQAAACCMRSESADVHADDVPDLPAAQCQERSQLCSISVYSWSVPALRGHILDAAVTVAVFACDMDTAMTHPDVCPQPPERRKSSQS